VQSLGPVQITATEVGTKLVYVSHALRTYTLTELTAVTVVKAVLTLAGEDMGGELGDISKSDRSHAICWCTKSVYVSHTVRTSESLTDATRRSGWGGCPPSELVVHTVAGSAER
jgi:hypothetical protein